MIKYLNSAVGFIYFNYEGTYHDECTTSIAVESKGHHVGLLLHLTFTGWVIEVQDSVVDASLRQETVGHIERGGRLLTNYWLTWRPVTKGDVSQLFNIEFMADCNSTFNTVRLASSKLIEALCISYVAEIFSV